MHKIAVVGPESSGKTELCRSLAEHFQEPWVREFAREYLLMQNGKYNQSDLWQIAKGQLALEAQATSKANNFLFCDTTLLVIKIWSQYKYGSIQPEVSAHYSTADYDLHLLLRPDIEYKDDPLRENPSIEERNELFEIYRQHLIQDKANYAVVEGKGNERLKSALKILHSHFSF